MNKVFLDKYEPVDVDPVLIETLCRGMELAVTDIIERRKEQARLIYQSRGKGCHHPRLMTVH